MAWNNHAAEKETQRNIPPSLGALQNTNSSLNILPSNYAPGRTAWLKKCLVL